MAQKHEREILREEIAEGLGALERSFPGLFVSALSGGLDLGFSLFLMAVMTTLTADASELVSRLLVANMYSIGFILVVLGRSELFTEQTTLAVLPVLHRRARLSQLARLWGVVYAGNIVGAALFAAIAVVVGPSLGVISPAAFAAIAEPLVEESWWVVLLSAALAGWLMGLLSWLVTAGRDTISQVFFVWLITASIGFAHLHHVVLGTVEVLSAVFSGGAAPAGFVHFLVWTTFGNTVGGVLFVALLKYTHSVRGGRLREIDLRPGER